MTKKAEGNSNDLDEIDTLGLSEEDVEFATAIGFPPSTKRAWARYRQTLKEILKKDAGEMTQEVSTEVTS